MELSIAAESWPIRGAFTISRGAKNEVRVIVATIRDGEYRGRGECVPYARYGETIESVSSQIKSAGEAMQSGITREELQRLLPAGAARNALDCALWDLEARRSGRTIWQLLEIDPKPRQTAITIGIDSPEKMAEAASRIGSKYTILKIKLGSEGDEERLRKIHEASPRGRLIVDANEGWTEEILRKMLPLCESVGVELIEQPLPAGADEFLRDLKTSIKICADESAHTSADIPQILGRYSAVNIKLDKSGGLTEALAMAHTAKETGLSIMVGCMVSTSLSMAPATVVAQYADYVDLDGPLLLEKDREPGIKYADGRILPTKSDFWG